MPTTPRHATATLLLAGTMGLSLLVVMISRPVRYDALGATQPVTFRIDPNTADRAELCLLPNVGPPTAQRFINHRQTYGRFRSANDLARVKGIGAKKQASIAPWLKFDESN